MITLLTPSKTMDFVTPSPTFAAQTTPLFHEEAAKVRNVLASYSVDQIMNLMHVSRTLAEQVVAMYADTLQQKQALWTYTGDVFKGFQARTIDAESSAFAEEHLLIASAVYGVLRPSDMIAPYRLEMRAKPVIEGFKDMYDFWGKKPAEYVSSCQELQGELCVLSSEEYAKVVTRQLSQEALRIATPAFIDTRADGSEAQIPIYNKMMRGVMARWIMDARVDSLDRLNEFTAHGYIYSQQRSADARPVFFRREMKPLVFV
jgi:cytoplasmic iron level regulating protein YaaA (DUF328/UPF0246 family)